METAALDDVRTAYETLRESFESAGMDLPANRPGPDGGNDLLLRYLDCAVIELLHQETEDAFDSVRGLFLEGEDLYPNAGFKTKNHVQICVRNPNCIKGYFLPRTPDSGYAIP